MLDSRKQIPYQPERTGFGNDPTDPYGGFDPAPPPSGDDPSQDWYGRHKNDYRDLYNWQIGEYKLNMWSGKLLDKIMMRAFGPLGLIYEVANFAFQKGNKDGLTLGQWMQAHNQADGKMPDLSVLDDSLKGKMNPQDLAALKDNLKNYQDAKSKGLSDWQAAIITIDGSKQMDEKEKLYNKRLMVAEATADEQTLAGLTADKNYQPTRDSWTGIWEAKGFNMKDHPWIENQDTSLKGASQTRSDFDFNTFMASQGQKQSTHPAHVGVDPWGGSLAGTGGSPNMKYDPSAIPPHLQPFFEDLFNNWFGKNGQQFKEWLYQDLEYQKKQFEMFKGKTNQYTGEYRAKLAELEKTYTNPPYTFNFRVLGQNVKNVPKRSLMTISTLSDLATKRYGAGMTQSQLELQGNSYFTPNRYQQDYMKYLMDLFGKMGGGGGYRPNPGDKKPDFWDWMNKGKDFWDLFKDIYGFFKS